MVQACEMEVVWQRSRLCFQNLPFLHGADSLTGHIKMPGSFLHWCAMPFLRGKRCAGHTTCIPGTEQDTVNVNTDHHASGWQVGGKWHIQEGDAGVRRRVTLTFPMSHFSSLKGPSSARILWGYVWLFIVFLSPLQIQFWLGGMEGGIKTSPCLQVEVQCKSNWLSNYFSSISNSNPLFWERLEWHASPAVSLKIEFTLS